MLTFRARTRLYPVVLTGLLLLALCTHGMRGTTLGGENDWVPPRADELRRWADIIDDSRRLGDDAAVRDGLVKLAEAIVDGDIDGGLSVAPGRWVGPGTYLDEIVRLLDEPEQRRALDSIDLILEGRLPMGWPPTGGRAPAPASASETLALRVARDFPRSRFAPAARAQLASLLLARGQLVGYSELMGGSALEAELGRWRHPPRIPLPAFSDAVPLAPVERVRPRRSMPVPPAPARALELAPVRVQPVVAGGHVYLQGIDELRALDVQTGHRSWRIGFLGQSEMPTPLPGTHLEPAIHGSQVVTATPRSVTAFDRESGEILWDRTLWALLAPVRRGATDRPASEVGGGNIDNPKPSLLALAPPVSSERGVVLAALWLGGDNTVTGRVALVDGSGRALWSRPLGTTRGATYAALGMARPALATLGERVYLLTERGFLVCLHLADGALLWAVQYPGYGPRGSDDALRAGDHFTEPALECRGDLVLGAPVDSGALQIWNRMTGEACAEIPRGAARWWSWAEGDEHAPLCLVSHDGVSFWRLVGARPRPAGRFEVPAGLPPLSGPAFGRGDDWWIPSSEGFYRVQSATGQWRFHPLDTGFPIERVTPAGDLVLAGHGVETVVLAPQPPPPGGGDTPSAQLRRIREHLLRGDGAVALALIERSLKQGPRTTVLYREREALVRVAMALAHPASLGLDEAQAGRLVLGVLRLMPAGAERSRIAFRQARRFARVGQLDAALRLAYLALQDAPPVRVAIAPSFDAPIDLAALALILQLQGAPPRLAADEFEERAEARLAKARRIDSAERFLEVARQLPHTRAGRRAALELAHRHFLDGNRRLSLEELGRLVLLEPHTPESVEARFRMAELHRDERRWTSARRLLDELVQRYGNLKITTPQGEQTVHERAEALAATLPTPVGQAEPPLDAGQQLLPVWTQRTELLHQRKVATFPLGQRPGLADDTLYLTVSGRTVELRDARDGAQVWVTRFPQSKRAKDRHFWSDLGKFKRDSVVLLDDGILLHDLESAVFLDLATGRLRWRVELPPPPADPDLGQDITEIALVAAADGVAVLLGEDGVLRGYEIAGGQPLWSEKLANPPLRAPEIRDGRMLLFSEAPPRAEIRNLATGQRVRQLAVAPDADPDDPDGFAEAPWFLDGDHVAFVLGGEPSRWLRVLEINSGAETWSLELPAPVRRIHRPAGLPFLIAELETTGRGQLPLLVGFSARNGRLLWNWTPRRHPTRLRDVRYSDGDLFLLEGDYSNRRLVCLRVPPSLLQPEVPEGLSPFGLELKWDEALAPGPAESPLFFHRDWILLQETYKSDLTVLTRQGTFDRTTKFEHAREFVGDRLGLIHASFIGETLLLITHRGSMGLRALSHLELTRLTWTALSEVDFLTSDEATTAPVAAAQAAYRRGQVAQSCSILERYLGDVRVSMEERRLLGPRLEGIAQQDGERSPLDWRVPRMPRAPVIDGTLDEPWNAATAYVVSSPRFFHPIQGLREDPGAWTGWQDQSVVIYCGWSDEGFHLALDVTDDSIHPYDRNQERWKGDCLLLAFDMDGKGGTTPHRDDLLLTLALTVPQAPDRLDPEGDGDGEDSEDPPEDDEPGGEFQVHRKPDGSGVIYEVTIPWDTFREHRRDGPVARAGMTFGMNLVLTDDDNGRSSTSYMSLSPGQKLSERTQQVWDLFAPDYFPRIRLER